MKSVRENTLRMRGSNSPPHWLVLFEQRRELVIVGRRRFAGTVIMGLEADFGHFVAVVALSCIRK